MALFLLSLLSPLEIRAGWRFEENDVEAGADKRDADAEGVA